MNKKVLTGCLALTLCLSASAPVYRYFTLNHENPDLSAFQSNTLLLDKVPSEAEVLKNENLELRKLYDKADENSETANTAEVKTTAAVNTAAPAAKAAAKTPSNAAKKTSVSPAKAASTKSKSAAKTAKRTTTSTSRGSAPATTSKAAAVINTAKSYIGVPYVWGGMSPSGFDCSGFTQYVLKKHGITIPRVTSDQFNAGVSVSKANLRVGDLVFFTTYKPGPSHVGFYIGNGNFIHASSSKGVTISSLSNVYFADKYIGARRVI